VASFAWGEKTLKIRDKAEDRHISKSQGLFRIEGALEASPDTVLRDNVHATGITPSTVFYALTQVLHLEFCNWSWLSHKFSDDQKRTRA
jgi:hypothetical protein